MLDREAAEALFLQHLDWIGRAASRACSRYGLGSAEEDDFASRVRMKLMEDDYLVIRRFNGDAKLKTYLAAVIARHFADFLREQRGRWRPSAAAERMGPPAGELEKLVRREGYTVRQAGERLRTAGRTTLSDIELARMLDKIPERAPLRPEVSEPAAGMDAPGEWRADERVLEAEADSQRAKMLGVLEEVVGQLEPEDRLIAQMHFAEDRSVADIARALSLEQKPLYRRVPRLRTRLRELLERAGLRKDDVRGLLNDENDAP